MKKLHQEKIICIGGHPHLNGGISSVVKAYVAAYTRGNYHFNFVPMRTTLYKHGSKFQNSLVFISAFSHLFLELLFSRRIKILHIHSSANLSFLREGLLLCLGHGLHRKTILHLHSSQFDQFFLESRGGARFFIRYTFARADIIVVLCKNWQMKLQSEYPEYADKIRVIYNPILLTSAQSLLPLPDRKGYNILCLGFLIPSKGIRDLIVVARQCADKHPHWNFHLAGIGELQMEVEQAAAELSNFHYHGWADSAHKEQLFRNSDIFFLPSYNEGMPISILEAMCFGLPFVSTAISGIPEITDGDERIGKLLPPGDIGGFIQALEYFENLCVREDIHDRIRNRVKRFDAKNIFHEVAQLYEELNPAAKVHLS